MGVIFDVFGWRIVMMTGRPYHEYIPFIGCGWYLRMKCEIFMLVIEVGTVLEGIQGSWMPRLRYR